MIKLKFRFLIIATLAMLSIDCFAIKKNNLPKQMFKFESISWSAKIITPKKTEILKVKNNQDDWLFENDNITCRIFKEMENSIYNMRVVLRFVTCALHKERIVFSTQVVCDPFSHGCYGNLSITGNDDKNVIKITILGEKK